MKQLIYTALLGLLVLAIPACQSGGQDGNVEQQGKAGSNEDNSIAAPEGLYDYFYHPQTREEVTKERYDYIRKHGSFSKLGNAFPYRSAGAGNWSNVGPGGAQNTCPEIEPRYTYAGRVISFAQDYGNRDLMYVGGASGGLWKTDNGGLSWSNVLDDLPHPSVATIEVNPGNCGEVWIGTGDRENGSRGSAAPSIGMVYKSEDEGSSWTPVDFTTTSISWISRIVLKPGATTSDDDIIFLATDNGIYRGTSAGDWSHLNELGFRPFSDVMVVGSPLAKTFSVVAAEKNGSSFWYSDNKGMPSSWEEKSLPGISNFGRVSLAASAMGLHDKVYANVAAANGGWAGVWRSDDKGNTWGQVTHPAGGGGAQMNYNNSIEVESIDGDRVYTGTNSREIYISNNGGNSWFSSANNNPDGSIHEDQQFILQDVTVNATIYIANDGGIYRTTDRGQSFEGLGNDFLPLGQIYHLTLSPINEGMYYIGTQDVGVMRGPDGLDQWQQLTCCDGGDIAFKGPIHYSTITGLNATSNNRYQYPPTPQVCQQWNGFANGLPSGQPWTANLIWSGNNFYTNFSDSTIYFTPNGTTSWSPFVGFNAPVNEIDAAEDGADETIIAGIGSGNPVRVSNRYSSAFHKPDEPDSFWETKRVTDIEIIKENAYGHEVVMGLSGTSGIRVVKSYNSGEHWTDHTGDLPEMVNVRSIIADPNNTDYMYIGTDFGVYVTNNNGINWFKYDEGLPGVSYVNDIHFDDNFDEVVAGTYGRGVFVADAAQGAIGVEALEQEQSLSVYPNPAENWLNVEWKNTPGNATIMLESLDGRLLHKYNAKGTEASLNVANLGTGMYLLRLQLAGGREVVRQFVKL